MLVRTILTTIASFLFILVNAAQSPRYPAYGVCQVRAAHARRADQAGRMRWSRRSMLFVTDPDLN